MELLYFISGILTVGIVYSILLLRKNQSSYADAIERLQSHQNLSSIRFGDMDEEIDRINLYTLDIKSKLEKDQYTSVAEINKKLEELNSMVNVMNNRLGVNQKVMETSISKTTTEINTLNNRLKALGQDPNFIR
jgi:flagellar capping protein FliD